MERGSQILEEARREGARLCCLLGAGGGEFLDRGVVVWRVGPTRSITFLQDRPGVVIILLDRRSGEIVHVLGREVEHDGVT